MEKKFGYAPLGPADGPIQRAIFGETSAKIYRYDIKKASGGDDRFAWVKSNYQRRPRAVEPAVRVRRSGPVKGPA
jgi:hypothetical protein